MFKMSEIKELIKLVDQTSVQELEIENEGTRLLIRKPNKTESVLVQTAPTLPTYTQVAPQAYLESKPAVVHADSESVMFAANPSVDEATSNLHKIVSPMVGTFYHAPSPDAPPFAKRGDKVTEKSVVCIIEAMKLMNEIEAEIKGEIVEVLVDNGQLVEYGQPLFLVKPE